MLTSDFTNEAFAALGAPHLVYVRPVKAADVMPGASPQAIEAAFQQVHLEPHQTLYALHGADGARLAVLADQESAYAAARAHELAPVAVH